MTRRLLPALLCLVALAASSPALASPKKRAKSTAAPRSAAISETMDGLSWGANEQELLETFKNQVREKHKKALRTAPGAIEEDKVRAKMNAELAHLERDKVQFDGTKTGWDVSFLRGEFTHNNEESMFVVPDEVSKNYYFFIKGRLWKWYKAFDASAFEGKTFPEFAEAIQRRYGVGVVRQGKPHPDSEPTSWLEWQDDGTRLRAVDNTEFYGFYCLVFEDKSVLAHLDELREARPVSAERGSALIDEVTSDSKEYSDGNRDIVDRITGKIRRRPDKDKKAN